MIRHVFCQRPPASRRFEIVNGSKPYNPAGIGRAPRRGQRRCAVQWFLSPHPSPLPWYVFSVSRFHVPQGRSKIAQRFIAGLWRKYRTSPVRDERTHQSSTIFSVAPPGLWPFSTRDPRLKPWATFGRPYRDFGLRALLSFNMTSTTPASSRREGTEHCARGACAGPTVNTYLPWEEGDRTDRILAAEALDKSKLTDEERSQLNEEETE